MRNIMLLNQSTLVTDTELTAVAAALQVQVNQHFQPVWDIGCNLTHITVDPNHVYNPVFEHIILLDNSDQAGALGYHLLDSADVPQGFVFVKTCQDNGVSWSSCASHELLEQLLDPLANACVAVTLPAAFKTDAGKAAAVSYEACDPVEGDTYSVNSVEVSNFILPSWLVDNYDKNKVTKFDYLGRLTSSLSMTSGGYISYTTDLQNWAQVNAQYEQVVKQDPDDKGFAKSLHGRLKGR